MPQKFSVAEHVDEKKRDPMTHLNHGGVEEGQCCNFRNATAICCSVYCSTNYHWLK